MHLLNRKWRLTCSVNVNLCKKQRSGRLFKQWLCIAPTKKRLFQKTASEAFGIDFLQCNSQDFTTQICNSCFHFSRFIHIQGSWYLTVFSLRIFNFFYLIILFSFLCFFFTSLLPQHPPKSKTVHCDCARERGGHDFQQNSVISSMFSFLQHCP